MPPTIPPPLAAYITDCLAPPEPVRSRQQRPPRAHTQTLVTSVLETPAPWLLLRLVYAALYGVEDTDDHHQQQRPQQGRRHVIFVSLLRPLGLWVEMGKKMVRTRYLMYLTRHGECVHHFSTASFVWVLCMSCMAFWEHCSCLLERDEIRCNLAPHGLRSAMIFRGAILVCLVSSRLWMWLSGSVFSGFFCLASLCFYAGWIDSLREALKLLSVYLFARWLSVPDRRTLPCKHTWHH